MDIIRKFIKEWNLADGDGLAFYAEAESDDRPPYIEVRFDPNRYRNFHEEGFWEMLKTEIDQRSHGLLVVSTTHGVFGIGILDLAVATMRSNYDPGRIIDTLTWLIQDLFRQQLDVRD